jgi:TonB family protein
MAGNLTLKIAASISLAIHLLFLWMASSIFQNPEVLRVPDRYVMVTLLPLVPREKPGAKITLPIPLRVGEQHLGEPALDSKTLNQDSPLPFQSITKNISLEEPLTTPREPEENRTVKEPLHAVMAEGPSSNANLAKGTSTVSSEEATANEGENFSVSLPAFQSGKLDGGTFSFGGSGERPGTGFENSNSGRGGSGKGKGIWGKFFPSRGGGAGSRPSYAGNPKPLYPPEAKERGYEGEVVLRVEVLVSGRVGQIEIKESSGYELLDRSALNTVKQWRFIPAKKDETPIPLWVNIPIKFQLQ